MIDGPWAEPRIYPDMNGILDNPDAAYAKLKEMGQGLFGADGGAASAGSAGCINGGATYRRQRRRQQRQSDPLGGQLGETLGNLLQQGLGQGPARAATCPVQPRPGARHPGRPARRPPAAPETSDDGDPAASRTASR